MRRIQPAKKTFISAPDVENHIQKRQRRSRFVPGRVRNVTERYFRQNIGVYKVVDFAGDPVIGSFYSDELQKVNKDETTLWIVEKVIRKRKLKGKKEN